MTKPPIPEAPEDTRYERLPCKMAFRVHEDTQSWVCLLVPIDTDDDADPDDSVIVLGHIDLPAVKRSRKARDLFMQAMQEAFCETIEHLTGQRPVFGMAS